MDQKLHEQISKISSIMPRIAIKKNLDSDTIDYSKLKEHVEQFLAENDIQDCQITAYHDKYEDLELHLICFKEKTDDEIKKELKQYEQRQESRLRQIEDEAKNIKTELGYI